MNISSVAQPIQQLSAQQASAAAAVSDDSGGDFEPVAASSTGSAGTGLSGSTTASLSDQTLQALLGLTQNDSSEQAQGAHHHHHRHHGGGGQQAPAQNAPANAASDPTASIAELDSSTAAGSDDSDSLATALGA
ncbi:MAG TPA: hypothetical protein VNW15_08405 [Rhizomicrobium sp.]|jgi:hypothetical protein|nr:hypothetical protein [Rhizomicrobium sp.]